MPNQQRKDAEARITEYARAGKWRTVLCTDYDEAHDFQWFCVDKLDSQGLSLLNRDRQPWNSSKADRYNQLWAKLMSPGNPLVFRDEIGSERAGPGVYVFYHEWRPEAGPPL